MKEFISTLQTWGSYFVMMNIQHKLSMDDHANIHDNTPKMEGNLWCAHLLMLIFQGFMMSIKGFMLSMIIWISCYLALGMFSIFFYGLEKYEINEVFTVTIVPKKSQPKPIFRVTEISGSWWIFLVHTTMRLVFQVFIVFMRGIVFLY